MSFTVEHIKDGKIIPIKLSIWDAFKGVPNPRPSKPKLCPCCKQAHPKKAPDESSPGDKGNEEVKSSGFQTQGEKPDGNQSHSNRAEETYNADDDAKIIAMKTANKSWKEILAAIGKESASQLKDHWKLINPSPKDKETSEEKKVDGKEEMKKLEEEEKPAGTDENKADGKVGKGKKKKKDGDKKAEEKSEPTKDSEKKEPAKSASSTNDMKTFANHYDKQKWKAAASKHFDLTGQRITPETARKMAEGK